MNKTNYPASTLADRVAMATISTKRAAALPDWRLSNRQERAARDRAANLAAGRGYIIASERHMRAIGEVVAPQVDERFCDLDRLRVWGYCDSVVAFRPSRSRSISMVAF